MSKLSRRSFQTASAAVSGSSVLGLAQAEEVRAGFDQTETDYDATQVWAPFSERKVRVGIVGHGICKFGLQFGLQDHPNVELVAVPGYYAHLSSMRDGETIKIPQYSPFGCILAPVRAS